jgi:hypothetical protein
MSRSRRTGPATQHHPADLLSDLAEDHAAVLSLEAIFGRTPLLKAMAVPRQARACPGDTPIFGDGAIARWIGLHDRACEMYAALRPGDSVGERQVQRVIRSLFLYEHLITPKTRWQARVRLWERDKSEQLPPFVEQRRWTQCRCSRCQASGCSPQPVSHLRQAIA